MQSAREHPARLPRLQFGVRGARWSRRRRTAAAAAAPETSVHARRGRRFDLHFEDSPQIRFARRIQTYLVFLSGVPDTRSRPQILCKLSRVGGRNYYMIRTHGAINTMIAIHF